MRDFPVQAKPAQENPVLVKSPEGGEFRAAFGWTGTVSTHCERAQTGAFLAVTGTVCRDVVEWCLCTTSCWRVKFHHGFVGLFLRERLVRLVSQILNETKTVHLFELYV